MLAGALDAALVAAVVAALVAAAPGMLISRTMCGARRRASGAGWGGEDGRHGSRLHALRHEVDAAHVVGAGVVGDGGERRLQLSVAHGDALHGVPGAALLHLDDLTVAAELVGDLAHAGHAGVGELYGVVAVTVRHDPGIRRRRQGGVLGVGW